MAEVGRVEWRLEAGGWKLESGQLQSVSHSVQSVSCVACVWPACGLCVPIGLCSGMV